MSGRGPSWGWSSMHNGKFWDMHKRLAEAEKRIAELEKRLERLDPPIEATIMLGLKHLEEDWPLPYSLILKEQEATEA